MSEVNKEIQEKQPEASSASSVKVVNEVKESVKERVIKTHHIRKSGIVADPIRLDDELVWMQFTKETGQTIRRDPININGVKYVCGFPNLPENLLILPSGLGVDMTPIELFQEIRTLLGEAFIAPSDSILTLLAQYILATWSFDTHEDICYIIFIGLPYSGKSVALKACASMSFNCFWASGSSTQAALLRMIDRIKGCAAIDEAQKEERENEPSSDFHKMLVEGNQRNGVVLKCAGEDFEPTPFSVFGPKFLSGRSTSTDEAVTSRTVEIRLPRLTSANVTEVADLSWQRRVGNLRNNLLHYRQRRVFFPAAPGLEFMKLLKADEFNPREIQVFRWLIVECPSVAVANEIIKFLKARRAELKEVRSFSLENYVLLAAYDLLPIPLPGVNHFGGDSRVLLKSIAGKLREWGHGDHAPRRIGKCLRDCGLKIKHYRDGNYLIATADQLLSIFERLGLPIPEGSLPSQSSHDGGLNV